MPRRSHRNEQHRHEERGFAQVGTPRELSCHEDGQHHECEDEAVGLRHVGHALFLYDSRRRQEVPARGCPDRDARRRDERHRDGDRDNGDGEAARIRSADPQLAARDRGHTETQREGRVQVRPHQDERRRRQEKPRSRPRCAKQKDERRKTAEAHELRALRPRKTRQHDRRERCDHGDDGPALGVQRRSNDERHDRGDQETAKHDDPAPIERGVRLVPDHLTEPLIGEHREAIHRPRELVDPRKALRDRLTSLREMPEEVGVANGREGGKCAEYPTGEKRERPRETARHGRSRTIHRPSRSDERTRQPSSRNATARGRSGRKSSSVTLYLSRRSCQPGRRPTSAR